MLVDGVCACITGSEQACLGHCRNRTTTLALDYINAFVEEKERLARRGQVLPLLCVSPVHHDADKECSLPRPPTG